MTGCASTSGNTAPRASALEAAQARLREQSERRIWDAYIRAVHLQWAEPGPTSTIIRDAIFKVWERAFHELSS